MVVYRSSFFMGFIYAAFSFSHSLILSFPHFLILSFASLHSPDKKLLQWFYKVFIGSKPDMVRPALFYFKF